MGTDALASKASGVCGMGTPAAFACAGGDGGVILPVFKMRRPGGQTGMCETDPYLDLGGS